VRSLRGRNEASGAGGRLEHGIAVAEICCVSRSPWRARLQNPLNLSLGAWIMLLLGQNDPVGRPLVRYFEVPPARAVERTGRRLSYWADLVFWHAIPKDRRRVGLSKRHFKFAVAKSNGRSTDIAHGAAATCASRQSTPHRSGTIFYFLEKSMNTDERIVKAIAEQGSDACTPSGPLLTLMTEFAREGKIAEIAEACFRAAHPANDPYVRGQSLAKS
jgi:hypothetical protein